MVGPSILIAAVSSGPLSSNVPRIIGEIQERKTSALSAVFTGVVALGEGLGDRAGPGCLNSISASISGASAGVRLPSGGAAG